MSKKKIDSSLPMQASDALRKLGESILIARKRRKITKKNMAERMFVSIPTLNRLEKGDPNVGIGILASALWCLGLHRQISSIANPDSDEIGKSLELNRLRTPKKLENDF